MKKCNVCDKDKPLDEFYTRYDGRLPQPTCVQCTTLRNSLRGRVNGRLVAPSIEHVRAVLQSRIPINPVVLNAAGHAPAPPTSSKPTHPKRVEAYRLLREADADESKDSSGFVYLISDGTAYKIGQSAAHPQTRLKSLQTGNPRLLVLEGYRPVDDRHAEESRLHAKHIKHNILGEWFQPAPAIRREFA